MPAKAVICGGCGSADLYIKGKCRSCWNAAQRALYRRNRVQVLARLAKRRRKVTCPERPCATCKTAKRKHLSYCGDCWNERVRKWRQSHPQRSIEINRRSYANNNHKHGDLRARGKARRRAREQSAPGLFTKADWARILEQQGYACIDCGSQTSKLTVGHAVPLSRGGSNWPENIIAQCGSCNSRQHDNIHRSRLLAA